MLNEYMCMIWEIYYKTTGFNRGKKTRIIILRIIKLNIRASRLRETRQTLDGRSLFPLLKKGVQQLAFTRKIKLIKNIEWLANLKKKKLLNELTKSETKRSCRGSTRYVLNVPRRLPRHERAKKKLDSQIMQSNYYNEFRKFAQLSEILIEKTLIKKKKKIWSCLLCPRTLR